MKSTDLLCIECLYLRQNKLKVTDLYMTIYGAMADDTKSQILVYPYRNKS